jgi:anti-anti-sigma regulatory factor
MYALSLEPPENLLVIRYTGALTMDEVEQCAKDIGPLLNKAGKGFRLLVDLSQLESMQMQCAPCIGRIMEMCRDAGVGSIARVIPDPKKDIGFQILSYFHYPSSIPIANCQSLDEAMKALSESG